MMMQAIKETETQCRTARASVAEAKRSIAGKLAQAHRFAPLAKARAQEELGDLTKKLEEAQKSLNNFATVRQDFEQRGEAKKMLEELSQKLSTAEGEVDKAVLTATPFGGDGLEWIKETEVALTKAQTVLTQTIRLLETKKKMSGGRGPLFHGSQELEERAKQAQERLDEARETMKETQDQALADAIVRDVAESAAAVEGEIQRMSDAEIMLGSEDVIGEEAAALLKDAEKIASESDAIFTKAHALFGKKLAEVARKPDGPLSLAKEEIEAQQKALEESRSTLQQFKAAVIQRKRSFALQEVETEVVAAEEHLQNLAESVRLLGESDMDVETIKETADQASVTEKEAMQSISSARKLLLQKIGEFRKLPGGGTDPNLSALQERVNKLQPELGRLRIANKEAEGRARAKQLLTELVAQFEAVDVEVEKATSTATALAEDEPDEDGIQNAREVIAGCRQQIDTTSKLIEAKMKTAAEPHVKKELNHMQARLGQAGTQLQNATATVNGQKELLAASQLILASTEKVEAVDAAVERSVEAEVALAEVAESGAENGLAAAMSEYEAAMSAAQKLLVTTRAPIAKQLIDAKRYVAKSAERCTEKLHGLVQRIDAHAKKLAELEKNTAERKRKAQMQISTERVAMAEAAFQKFSEAVSGFSVTMMDDVAAQTAVESVSSSQTEAEQALTTARQCLTEQVKSLRTFAEAQRAEISAVMAKLKARTDKCHAEVVKQAKEWSEKRDQWFQAHLTKALEEVIAVVQSADVKATKVLEGVQGMATFKNKERGIMEMETMKREADEAIKSLAGAAKAVETLEKSHESNKGAGQGLESRVKIMSLKSRVSAKEKKVSVVAEQIRTMHAEKTKASLESARKALKAAARRTGESSDSIFERHGGGADQLSEESFRSLVQSLPDHGLAEEQITLLFGDSGATGLRRPEFAKATQEFRVCTKAVAILDASGMSHEMPVGEILELVEAASPGGASQSRVRAVSRGICGSATIASADTKPANKPFVRCVQPTDLFEQADEKSTVVRQLRADEVLELLEGPRTLLEETEAETEVRMYVKSSKDGSVGWLLTRDAVGTTRATPSTGVYVCKKTVAMTDILDVASAKAKRKLEVGEVFAAVGSEEVETNGTTRRQLKSVKHGDDGWVTLKSNRGATLVEASTSHWVVEHETVLRVSQDDASDEIRTLEVGELVEAVAAPNEKTETKQVTHLRSLDDCASGWIVCSSLSSPSVKPHLA